MQRPGRQDVLVHVVEVVGEDEVLGGRRAQAQEGRVQVEGRGQGRQTRVVDHAEARQRLDLLPAVELLPQRRRHLRQGLSEGGGAGRLGEEMVRSGEARGQLYNLLLKACLRGWCVQGWLNTC